MRTRQFEIMIICRLAIATKQGQTIRVLVPRDDTYFSQEFSHIIDMYTLGLDGLLCWEFESSAYGQDGLE